jgi:hypothetical protein
MDPIEIEAALSPIEQENQVLEYFKNNFTTNPKKLCKMAVRIWNDQPAFIQKGLLQNILDAADPVNMLRDFFHMMDEWKQIVPSLIADGAHGMIVDKKNVIFGVEIKANEKWLRSNDLWNPDQEADIQDEVMKQWMADQGLKHFHGKIVLFDNFGFSGMCREIFL